MKTSLCSLILAACISSLLAPAIAATRAQQPATPQMFEQFISRAREVLKLDEEQVAKLRQVLAAREAKISDLRRRAQSNPFGQQIQTELQREQAAIRDEMAAFLNDEQKARLARFNAPLPVPVAPPFVLINIPPRERAQAGDGKPFAAVERTIPAPVATRNRSLSEDQRILHLLNRVTFGPRPGDLERVRQTGAAKFLEEQLVPASIDDSELERRLLALPTQQMTSAELYQFYPPPPVADQRAGQTNAPPIFGRPQQVAGELVQQKLARAVASNRQLQEVMVDFWFNHFNVFAQKEAAAWLVTSYERDVIRPRAMGKFRDLLAAVAESAAMLFYLDNWLSASPEAKEPRPPAPPRPPAARPSQPPEAMGGAGVMGDASMKAKLEGSQPQPVGNPQPQVPNPRPQQPQRRRGINENYARELMELHTLGVDGGYTQRDVQEVARCFTGWTIDRPFQGGGFVFRPWMHDAGSKTVLGVTIPAGGGMSDGLRVIDLLARHPATARLISKKLCQRFVADDPPPQLVERAAQVFLKTDGDIREVLRAILTSPQFYSASAFRSKVKSPLELAASAIRAVDGDTNGAPPLHEWLRRMGEPLYQNQSPTGYSERSSDWMNTGVFLNRLNFAVALAANQIPGTSFDPARLTQLDAVAGVDDLINPLSALLVHTELSSESRRAVVAGLAEQPAESTTLQARTAMTSPERTVVVPVRAAAASDATPARRLAAQLIGLLLGTSEFQRK